jgi:hypothetical protein
MTRARLVPLLVVLGSLTLGFVVTAPGMATWDSLPHLDRSRWLVHMYGLPSSWRSDGLEETLKWYGPLWALFLGLASQVVLPFVRDPLWVEQAFNFALWPVGLYAVGRLLTRAGVRPSTALLAVALLFGAVRMGGHALVNVNDFPMAMLSLLVMLYLWVALREFDQTRSLRERERAARAAGRFPWPTLAGLGVVAMVPSLIRPPVLLQPLTLALFLVFYGAFVLRGARAAPRLALPLVPLGAGALFAVVVWPALWEHGRGLPLGRGLLTFAHFPWQGVVRYFGRSTPAGSLPRLYPAFWFPVMLTPVAFALFAVGLARGVFRGALAPQSFLLPVLPGPGGRTLDLSLRRWLALHAALLWLAVILLHPPAYDEERHFLYLYPPLLVLGALGLDDLGERLKLALAALVIVTAAVSYAGWGRYAYVYKSPLVGDRSADRFMGDYWGVCVPLAVDALAGRVPAGAEVVVPEPTDAARAQYDRLRAGPFARPGFGPYRIVRQRTTWPAYLILTNRLGDDAAGIRAAAQGLGRELWRAEMPPGDPACVLLAADGPAPGGARANGLGAGPAAR